LTAAGLATDAVNEIQSGLATAAALATVDTVVGSIFVDTTEIGVAGAGLTALAPAATALSTSQWTNTRAGYLDNLSAGAVAQASTALSTATWTGTRAGYLDKLNITGNVASSAEVTAIQNNTRIVFVVPEQLIRPASGTTTIYARVYLYDEIGQMETPDSAPTIELRNATGTDLTSRLASPTGTLESTGVYRWSYTSTSTDDLEQLLWSLTVVEGGNTRLNGRTSWVAETYTTDFTSSDRTTLNNIYGYVDSISTDVWGHGTRTLTALPTIPTNWLTADGLASDAVTEIQSGLSTLNAAGVRSAVGLASANLDTQLSTIDTVADSILVDTAEIGVAGAGLTAIPWNVSWDAEVQSECADALAAYNTSTLTASGVWGNATRTLSAFAFTVDTNANATETAIKAKTDLIPASPAAVGSAMTLTSGERDSIATALLDLSNGVETSVTVRNALRYIASSVVGVLSGAGGTGTATITIKAIGNDGTTRLTVETDEDGNRTSVTLA